MRTLFIATGVALAGAGLLTGCTSSSTSHGKTTAAVNKKATPTLVQGKLPTKISNSATVRKFVTQTKCGAITGGWSASGTAKNPTTAERTYKITVFFTTTHATTLNFAITTVKVAPSKTGTWTASKKFPAQKQMLCPMPGISAT
jgi:hypothetical protein